MAASTPEPSPAHAPNPRLRRKLLLYTILSFLVLVWMRNESDQRRIKTEVAPLTEKHARDLKEEGLELATAVTVTRPYLFAGEPTAKIAVYRRSTRAGDHTIQGVSYYYQRNATGWTLTESGGCSGEECQAEGQRAFGGK